MGIGLATYVEICGFGPWEMGSVYMDENAKVTILTGSSPHGQGHETTWAQIAADALQIPPEDIVVVRHGDTSVVPRGIGTCGSRSTAVAGSSVHNNAIAVRDKAWHIAAHLLEAAVEDVGVVNGPLGVKGIGEAATIGATPTIVNAVLDALAHLAIHTLDMPLTAEKLWRAIQQARLS